MDKATLFRDHDYGALALALSEGHVSVWDHNLVQEDAHAIRQVLGRYARLVDEGDERWRVRSDVYVPKMMRAVIQEMRSRGYSTDPLGERAILDEVEIAVAQAPDLPSARSPLVHDAVELGVRQHLGLAVAALREHAVCSTPSVKFHERPNAARVGVQRPPFVVARMFTGSMVESKVRDIVLEALKPIRQSIVKLSVMESEEGTAVEIGLAIDPSVMESYLDKRLPVFEHKVTGARDVLFLLESPLDAQALEDLTKMARLTTAATSVMSEQNALVIRVPSGYSGDHLADHALRERIEWLANTLEPWGVSIHEVGELTEVQAPTPEPERKPLAELGECAHHDHPPMKTVAMMMEEDDCEEHLERAGMTERESSLAARAWDYEIKRGGTPSSWMRRVQECTGRSHDDLNNIITEATDPSFNFNRAMQGLVILEKRLTDARAQDEAKAIRRLVKEGVRGLDAVKLRQARNRVQDIARKVLRDGNASLATIAGGVDEHLMLYMIRKGLEEGVLDEARTKTVTIDGVKLDTVWSGPKNGYTVVVASDWDKLDDLVAKGKLRAWHGGPSTMGHVSYLLNEARRPSARKIEHDKLMAKALMRQGVRTMRPINRSEYPTKPGLEGPFQFKHGHILYYDPKEGSYYDSKSDRYVSLSDIGESLDEAAPSGKAQMAIVKLLKDGPMALNDMTGSSSLRGVHYGRIQSAAEALVKKGILKKKGDKLSLAEAETLGATFVIPSDRTDAVYTRPGELSGEDDEEAKDRDRYIDDDNLDLAQEESLNEAPRFDRRIMVQEFTKYVRMVIGHLPPVGGNDAVLKKIIWRMNKYDGEPNTPHPASDILRELDRWIKTSQFLLRENPRAATAMRSALPLARALADMTEGMEETETYGQYRKRLTKAQSQVDRKKQPLLHKLMGPRSKAQRRKDGIKGATPKGTKAEGMDEDADVANMILKQIRRGMGGLNYGAMGIKRGSIYSSSGGSGIMGAMDVKGPGVQFDVRGHWKGRVIVRLDQGRDTYTVIFGRVRGSNWKIDKRLDDIYAGQLGKTIDRNVLGNGIRESVDEGWLNERTEALPDNADTFLRKMVPKKLKGVGIPGMDWIGQPKLANNRMSYGGAMFSRDSKVAPGAYYFFIDKPNRITRDWSAELVIKTSTSRTKIVTGFGDTVAKALNNLRVQIDPTKVIVVHGLQVGDRVSGKYYGTTFKGALVRNSRGHSGLYLDFDAESSPFPFKHKGREYDGVMLTPFSFGGKMAFNRASHSYIDTVNGKVVESAPRKWEKVSI